VTAAQFDSTRYQDTLLVSLELSHQAWKLGFFTESIGRVRVRSIEARNISQLEQEVERAKEKFGLPGEAPVQCCYEAGRDGFWLDRLLQGMGWGNFVIESSSLEVDRRSKRCKTDRIDAEKMTFALARFCRGEASALRVVNVPDPADEDIRNLQRELKSIRAERTRGNNRIKSLLCAQGVIIDQIDSKFIERVDTFRTGDDRPLGASLKQRLVREFERMRLCVTQIREIETQRAELVRAAIKNSEMADRRSLIAARLMELCGIGIEGAWTLSTELFAWRAFRNRKQVAAVVGLTPMPYDSGERSREQGISKAGRGELRALLVELSWLWHRYQPTSALTRWYFARAGDAGGRIRRISIVAMARKLLVSLWKYVSSGLIPEGAKLKSDIQQSRFRITASLG
jgi:transposase